MYLNVNLITSKGFTLREVLILQLLKQNQTEDLEKELVLYLSDDILERFKEDGLITSIKKRRKDESDFRVMRLSTKGKKMLKDFTENFEGTEEDRIIAEWAIEQYKRKDKEVGNEGRVKKYLTLFRQETDIDKNKLAYLIGHFLKDDYVDDTSRVLEYALFYPKKFTTDGGRTIAFQATWDVEDSWLYRHYLKNKKEFDEKFETL